MADTIDEFERIVKELKRIKKEQKLKDLDDNLLFDGAVRIYNSLTINKPAARRDRAASATSAMQAPITEKQKKLLKDLGYEGDVNRLTKLEATKLIQDYFDRQKAQRKG